MHDFLKLVSLLKTIALGRDYAINIGYLILGVIVVYLWFSENVLAKAISFLSVDIALYFVLVVFLSSPVDFLYYLSLKIFSISFTVLRYGIKIILLILAIILSFVYFISPVDIIPDVFLGIGWIDDLLLASGLIIGAISSDVRIPEYRLGYSESAYPTLKRIITVMLSTAITYILRIVTV